MGDATIPRLIDRIKERIEHPELAGDDEGIITLEVSPPATSAMVDAAEQALGFALTPLLRRLYLEVGNGGFGPDYGLIGVPGGAVDDTGRNIVDLYQGFRARENDDPAWQWPAKLLPVCHLGCAMYVCVDCSDASGAVSWWEPNPGAPEDVPLIPLAPSLEDWLWKWVCNEDWDWMNAAYDASPLKRWLDEHYPERG